MRCSGRRFGIQHARLSCRSRFARTSSRQVRAESPRARQNRMPGTSTSDDVPLSARWFVASFPTVLNLAVEPIPEKIEYDLYGPSGGIGCRYARTHGHTHMLPLT